MVASVVGNHPSIHMVGVLMSYDFNAFSHSPPVGFTVKEASTRFLWLVRKRENIREDFLVTHNEGIFTLYRAGPYDRVVLPDGVQKDQYAILCTKHIAPLLAVLGYKVRPATAPVAFSGNQPPKF